MKEGQGEARPDRELTSREQGGAHAHKDSKANNPIAPLMQGEQGWYERPHEELVKAFRNYVQERVQATEGQFSPAEIITGGIRLSAQPRNRREADFYSQLSLAWDALAFDHYTPGSLDDFRAGDTLHSQYRHAKVEAIKLTDPLQIRIIDALTEAVGIPHQKGQSEIKIPEKLKDYLDWIYSTENEERIDNYLREREARKTRSEPRHTEPKRNT